MPCSVHVHINFSLNILILTIDQVYITSVWCFWFFLLISYFYKWILSQCIITNSCLNRFLACLTLFNFSFQFVSLHPTNMYCSLSFTLVRKIMYLRESIFVSLIKAICYFSIPPPTKWYICDCKRLQISVLSSFALQTDQNVLYWIVYTEHKYNYIIR